MSRPPEDGSELGSRELASSSSLHLGASSGPALDASLTAPPSLFQQHAKPLSASIHVASPPTPQVYFLQEAQRTSALEMVPRDSGTSCSGLDTSDPASPRQRKREAGQPGMPLVQGEAGVRMPCWGSRCLPRPNLEARGKCCSLCGAAPPQD